MGGRIVEVVGNGVIRRSAKFLLTGIPGLENAIMDLLFRLEVYGE